LGGGHRVFFRIAKFVSNHFFSPAGVKGSKTHRFWGGGNYPFFLPRLVFKSGSFMGFYVRFLRVKGVIFLLIFFGNTRAFWHLFFRFSKGPISFFFYGWLFFWWGEKKTLIWGGDQGGACLRVFFSDWGAFFPFLVK